MLKHKFLIFALIISQCLYAQTSADAWINEFHYDNVGTDVGEFVEVVIKNVSTYPAANWTLTLYNGSNGSKYGSKTSSSSGVTSTTVNGVTILDIPVSGLQNGAPDGFSLDYNGTVVQFLSYEGSFTASNDVASGSTSVSVGVSETASHTQVGQSLQLDGIGHSYNDFRWQSAAADTDGAFNNNQIIVSTSTALTIDAGDNYSIYDAVQVASLDNSGTLTISASSSSYGQLKVSGSLANPGTIIQEQYIGSSGHHGISSPMTAGFGTTSGTASALYEYDAASSGVYLGSYVSNGTATTSTVGRGFFAPVGSAGDFLSSAGSFSVTGTPNTSHDWTLSYVTNSQSGASDDGWNLIGNPYSATLDWSSVSVGSSVNGAVYVWDPSNSQYMSWTSAGGGVNGGSQYIPPMQAFWVQTTSGGTGTAYDISTTMSSNTTTSQYPTFQKTQNDRIKLSVINLSDNTKNDETVIAHSIGSVDGFDEKLDAWKLNNYGGNPNVYTFYAGDKLAVNVVDLSIPKVIPLGIDAPQSRDVYQLYLTQEVNGNEYQVILEDKHLNTFTDISNAAYSFQYDGGNNSGPRFNLHIGGVNNIGIDEDEAIDNFVYQLDNEVFIHADESVYSTYQLWTIDGRLMHEGSIHSSITRFSKPQTGIYLVQLKGNSSNKAIKTFLK